MAYTISNTDGSTLVLLSDNTIDQSSTSLTLVGKNYSNYGQYVNNNFISLLENFAGPFSSQPRSPVTGQLWYNTTSKRLNVYDNGFSAVGGAQVSGSQPTVLSTGDLWWDSSNNQLNLYNGGQLFTVGPAFSKSVGTNGWWVSTATIVDSTASIVQQVTFLSNYGTTIGALSNETFTMTSNDSKTYFNTSTATVVSGLTINANLQVNGQVSNYYLSAYVDIDVTTSTNNVSVYTQYQAQNLYIMERILNAMYPVLPNTAHNEYGVPIGTEARVVCKYSTPSTGMQIRRFKVVNQPGFGISWQPYEVYSTGTTIANSVAVVTNNPVNVMTP